MISYSLVLIKSPGIAGRKYYKDTFVFDKEEEKLNYQQCAVCNIIIPKSFKAEHCVKCGICIIKRHHHCPWTGKCVGRDNKKIFLFF